MIDAFECLAAGASALFSSRALDVAFHSHSVIAVEQPERSLPSLSVVVPARNEERQIERCVRSLLAQNHPEFEVIAVDDESTDATHAILEGIAREDRRLHVVRGEPMPAGWVGKPWALHQGAQLASGEYLLFTDADTVHEPCAAVSAQRFMLERKVDVLSLLTTQELGSTAERILLPSILTAIALVVGSLDAINDPRRKAAALFNGQYILFRRAAYDGIGGHETVRAKIAEDYELARLLKEDGRFRTMLAGANGLVRTRMYRSFGEIWNGFTKNLSLGARGDPAKIVAGIALQTCIAPLPEVLLLRALLRRKAQAAGVMLAAICAQVVSAEVVMRGSRFPRGSGLWAPIGLSTMTAIVVNSAVRFASGRGVVWRGRRYR